MRYFREQGVFSRLRHKSGVEGLVVEYREKIVPGGKWEGRALLAGERGVEIEVTISPDDPRHALVTGPLEDFGLVGEDALR